MRIVVRCQDTRAAREAQALLADAGVEAVALPGAARSAEGEDVVIVAAMDGVAGAEAFASTSIAAKHDALAVLAGVKTNMPPALGLETPPSLAGAISLDASPKLLAAQIAAYIRAGVTMEESARRRATAKALGIALPKPLAAKKLKALYVGAPSAFFLKLENTFSRHGGLTAAAFSSFTGFDHLHDESFDAVVLNGAQDSATALSLCAALRRNAALHHLPTLVLTASGDEKTAKTAIDRGACAVAPADVKDTPALGWLFDAIRRERKRNGAEHDLRALRDLMGEARTGLFRPEPFGAHLARLADDHHTSGRPLAVAALRVLPAHGARQPSEDVWKKGFAEIATLAGRLVRETDSGAALGDDLIAFALPATTQKGARRTAERVASVAECTAFASGEGGAGPLVFEQSVAELQPGESGAALLARALGAIEVTAATA